MEATKTINNTEELVKYSNQPQIQFSSYGSKMVAIVSKQLIAKVTNFNESGESHLVIDDIPYGVYLQLFSDIKPIDVIEKVIEKPEEVIILASVRQRGKKSIYHRGTDYSSSTWNYESINAGMISWITQTSIPTIKLNSNTLDRYEFLSKWDGESKAQLKMHFVKKPKAELWKVLDGVEFTKEVNHFIKNPNRFNDGKNNQESVSSLIAMFYEFQAEQETKTDTKTRTPFITYYWMIQNGYGKLIDRILQLKPVIIIQNLPDAVESEAYYREGKHGQPQTDIHLVNSLIKDAWYKNTRYEKKGNPRELFYKYLTDSCFVNGKKNPFYKDINSDIFTNAQYEGLDEYIYDFILATLINIDTDNCKMNVGDVVKDTSFYRAIARPKDSGTQLVKKQVEDYHKLISNCSSAKSKKDVDKKIKEVFEAIVHIFGHSGSDKLTNVGYKSELLISNYKDYQKKELKEIRKHIGKWGVKRDSGLGKFDKLQIKQYEKLITQNTLSYYLQNSDLAKTHITKLLIEVYSFVCDNWLDYVFTYKLKLHNDIKNVDGHIPAYEHDTFDEVKKQTDDRLEEPIFGMLYGLHGGNLEKVFYVFDKFWDEKVIPHLENVYGDLSSTTKEMRKFRGWLNREPEFSTSFVENFKILSVNGDTIYNLNNFDIGHPDAESRGGMLFHKQFLLEESQHNRYEHTTESKEMESYYKCLIANHNDIHQQSVKEIENGFSQEKFVKHKEIDECKGCLKALLRYLNLEHLLQTEWSYINGNVTEKEYLEK